MKKLVFLFTILFFFSINVYCEDTAEKDETNSESKEKTDESESAAPEKEKPKQKNIFALPEPEYTDDYDEEPIKFFGIDARWLSDRLPNHGLSHVFSFDFNYLLNDQSRTGWGIGLNYEQKVWRYISLKSRGAVASEAFIDSKNKCIDYSIDFSTFFYPFGKGLEWLYLGYGVGYDVLKYSGPKINSDETNYIFSMMPTIGWKQIFFDNLMIDLNVGYRFNLNDVPTYDDYNDIVRSGWQFGFKFVILWNEVLRHFLDNYIIKKQNKRSLQRERANEIK